jgi:hypothetical protein
MMEHKGRASPVPIELPQPISAYYEADKNQKHVVSGCFTEDAVVIDEGHRYVGRDAIQEWKAQSSKKYSYTVEPLAVEALPHKILVTARVVGNFPGSPVNLQYFFELQGDKIASLEIKL